MGRARIVPDGSRSSVGACELDVVGVRVEMPSNAPMVLLREVGGTRYLPIWIGASEASAIANAQEGVVPPRPLTHDLMVDTLNTLGHRLTEVHITELEGGTFYAVLLVDGIEVSARPSDAIALALRWGRHLLCRGRAGRGRHRDSRTGRRRSREVS